MGKIDGDCFIRVKEAIENGKNSTKNN